MSCANRFSSWHLILVTTEISRWDLTFVTTIIRISISIITFSRLTLPNCYNTITTVCSAYDSIRSCDCAKLPSSTYLLTFRNFISESIRYCTQGCIRDLILPGFSSREWVVGSDRITQLNEEQKKENYSRTFHY